MKLILGILVLIIAAPTLAQAHSVHARGRVLFVDSDGAKKPFARVQVRLMDQDSDYDEEIARGFTDKDGRYQLSGFASDTGCIACGHPDPYVKVVLEDPGRVEVHDIMHFTRNARVTSVREETAGEIDFGTRTFTDEYPEGMAAILYMRAQRAYDVFTKLSGDSKVPGNGGEVAIEIPVVLSFGTPYTTWDTIHWPGVKKDFGVFDHEFGHRLRHAADGGVVHFNNDLTLYRYARFHKPDEDTNLGFAFNEGWAHYFRHQVQPNFMDGQWLGTNKGDEVEGHVAVKLIAISDICGGFKPMWRALKNNPGDLHSFKEFFDAFIATRPPCSLDLGFNRPSPPKRAPRKLRDLPVADATLLATMRDDLKKQVDHIDARSAAMPRRTTPRIPSSIRVQDRAVIERLWSKRLQSAEGSDTRTRATYRRLVTGLRPMTPESIRNGSYERDARAARSAFILAVAQPRLREAQNIRRDIATEKSKTADPALLSYLGRLDTKYVRLEEELKRALAVRNGPGVKPPLGILPRSFAGSARSGN